MTIRTQNDYNTLIGYNADGDAVVLNYTFSYEDGLHGATGSVIELVSAESYADQTSFEALADYWEDIWLGDPSHNGSTRGLKTFVRNNRAELIESQYDGSDRELVPEGSHKTTNCIGGGRIFPREIDNLVTIVRPDLVEIIRQAEAGN